MRMTFLAAFPALGLVAYPFSLASASFVNRSDYLTGSHQLLGSADGCKIPSIDFSFIHLYNEYCFIATEKCDFSSFVGKL